jgi:hypothetical protein
LVFQALFGDVADFDACFPQARIVLNHVGDVAIDPCAGKHDEASAAWRAKAQEVTSFPKTYVKLGCLGMKMTGLDFFENPASPSSQGLADRHTQPRHGPVNRDSLARVSDQCRKVRCSIHGERSRLCRVVARGE